MDNITTAPQLAADYYNDLRLFYRMTGKTSNPNRPINRAMAVVQPAANIVSGNKLYLRANDVLNAPTVITAIEVVDNVTLSACMTPNGTQDVMNAASLARGFLVFSATQEQDTIILPLSTLITRLNNGLRANLNIQVSKFNGCYLYFPNASGITLANAIYMVFHYRRI